MNDRASLSFTFVGIPNSEDLRQRIEAFISNIRNNVPEDQIPLLKGVLEDFLDEGIDTLIIGGARAMRLHGMPLKVVELLVSTTKSTCHMLSNRILRKMSNADVRQLAEYMDVLREVREREDGSLQSWTAIPIDAPLMQRIDAFRALARAQEAAAHIRELELIILALMDAIVEHLYTRTLHNLKLGPIASRMVELGYKAVHSGAHAMVGKVLPSLSAEQISSAIEFCYGLIVPPEQKSA